MQIVIDILEHRYKDIQRIASVQLDRDRYQTAEQIIANGTPLPKGHGRIIDESQIRSVTMRCDEDKIDGWRLHHEYVDSTDAPTIIEADKAESDSPNFESKEYVEERINNYNNMLKSGILDCITEKPQESEDSV